MMLFLVASANYVYKTSNSYKCEKRFYFWRPSIFFICSIFALFFGVRYDTGIDHLSYLNIYKNAFSPIYTDDLEKGFLILTRTLANLDLHFFFFFAFFAFIQIFLLFYAFREDQFLYPFLLFILMTSFFISWMNTMRQCTAFCVFLCSINLILQKKFVKYSAILLLTSFFFHKSAIFLIFIFPFFIKCTDYTPNVKIQIIIFFTFIYLNRSSWIQNYFDVIASITNFTQYANEYADRIADFNRDWNFGPRVILGIIVNLFTFIISPYVKNFYNSKRFNIFYSLYFYGTCLWILFYGNFIIQRPIEYLYYLGLPVYAYTLYYLRSCYKKKKKQPQFLAYLGLHILVYCGTIYSTNIPEEVTAFHFFWEY